MTVISDGVNWAADQHIHSTHLVVFKNHAPTDLMIDTDTGTSFSVFKPRAGIGKWLMTCKVLVLSSSTDSRVCHCKCDQGGSGQHCMKRTRITDKLCLSRARQVDQALSQNWQ